jgi:hypothetical protein
MKKNIWGIVLSLLICFSGLLSDSKAFANASSTQPLKVELGLYLMDVAKLDVKESEFFADFYIWYKVPPNSNWTPEFIEFMNGTIEKATPATPDTSINKKYWIQRIKGRFRGHFRLHSYPFDRQELPIIIEDSEMPSSELVFVPDPDISSAAMDWVEPELEVPDWKKAGAEITVDKHQYKTDFGLGTKTESNYSRFQFQIKLRRLFLPHLIKFILPLIIIAGMAYMVFFINASEFETQCAICVTALLSAVALHIAQADALPAVGYLVMSDKIFILFYVVIFSALVQTVVVNNYAKRKKFETAIWLDQIFRIWYVVILMLGNVLVFILS